MKSCSRRVAAAAVVICASSSQGEVISNQRYNIRLYQQEQFEASFVNPVEGDEPGIKQVVFSIDLVDPLVEGEILLAMGELHARQQEFDIDGQVAVGSSVYLGLQSTFEWDPETGEPPDPFEITERNGETGTLGLSSRRTSRSVRSRSLPGTPSNGSLSTSTRELRHPTPVRRRWSSWMRTKMLRIHPQTTREAE
jgi:hypothetical protein